MYLVISALTSSPVSLVAATKAYILPCVIKNSCADVQISITIRIQAFRDVSIQIKHNLHCHYNPYVHISRQKILSGETTSSSAEQQAPSISSSQQSATCLCLQPDESSAGGLILPVKNT